MKKVLQESNYDSEDYQYLSTAVHSDATSNLSLSLCESEFSSSSDEPEQIEYTSFNSAGWLTVLGGVCTHLIVGNQYLWGNVNSYVISHFHNMGDDVRNNQASVILPLQMLVMCCTNPIGAYLQKRIDPKVLLNMGYLLVFSSVYISTNVAYKWSTFVIFFGILQAIGYGLLFWTPILCSWEWFGKEDRGKATGIILAGFGVSPFIFGIITTAIVNPDNVKRVKDSISGQSYFPESVSNKIPEMYQICLCIWIVLATISILTVKRNPEQIYADQQRRKNEKSQKLNQNVQQKKMDGIVTVKQGLKSKQFLILFIMMFNGVFFGIFIAGNYKIINLDNLSDKVLTLAGAIGAIGNAISRILCSSLQDKYGFKRIYTPILIIQLITCLMMYQFRESSIFYSIFVFLAFFSEGAHFAMFPTVAVNIFGVENGGQIFTYMFFCVPMSAISSGLVVNFEEVIGTENIFYISGFLTLINIILLPHLKEQKIVPKIINQSQSRTIKIEMSTQTQEDKYYQFKH